MRKDKKMLDGVKVIDLSRNLAAPYCTMVLADLGAEVIKVEMPEKGDDARTYGPFINGKSGYFLSVNRGKKSVTLNLKKTEDKDKLSKLLLTADVMVDNFRPGVLDRLGITSEWVKSINPKIIFSSITGFGQTGPYRTKAAYDLVVQGYGGIMSITGEDGGNPIKVGISIGDLAAGLFMTIGILADLYAREKTQLGDRLDVSMLDCQVALLENSLVRYFSSDIIPRPIGNRHPSITPFEAYNTKDGNIIICAGNPKNWDDLCNALEINFLKEDERFLNNDLRTKNHIALAEILNKYLEKRNTADWLEILEEYGIPCAPVNSIADVTKNEQILSRDMIIDINYPEIGNIKSPGCPIKSSNYSTYPTMPAPELGQNNEEILSDI